MQKGIETREQVKFIGNWRKKGVSVSECWRFYAVPTARVIFMAKTCVDVFSLMNYLGV